MSNYQIRVKGELDPRYAELFGILALTHTPDGDTLLTVEIIDQAALHGVLARCRDLGITLISVNPVYPVNSGRSSKSAEISNGKVETNGKKEIEMSVIHAEYSTVIDANAKDIYAVLADYHVGHAAILPRPPFTDLIVEKGGIGAGTVLTTRVKAYGRIMSYHQVVSEPEPGRVIMEKDMDTAQYSMFTLDPLNGGKQTRVTIFCEFPVVPGFEGVLQRMFQPAYSRGILKQELHNLAHYLHNNATVVNPA